MKIRPVPAVSRAVAILRLLADSEEPKGVHAIARTLGLVPSTCLHILRQLVVENLVNFHESKKQYSLAPGILNLAGGLLRTTGLAYAAQPLLDELTAKYSISAGLMQVVSLDQIVVIGISNQKGLGIKVELGTTLSSLDSASGRVVANYCGLSNSELSRRFEHLKWSKRLSFRRWLTECDEAKQKGYGVDYGNFTLGIVVVSVPVWGPTQKVDHTVVALGVREGVERVGIEAVADDLKKIADQLNASAPLKVTCPHA